MKIVINVCYGGFSLSKPVYDELGIEWDGYGYLHLDDENWKWETENSMRSDQRLIAAIEKVGVKNASGELSELEIVDIPDDVDWYIDDYDGIETVHEAHRSWG